jgi:hypothetical protein
MAGGGKKRDRGAERRAEEERELAREQQRMLQRALEAQANESAQLKQILGEQLESSKMQMDVLAAQNQMLAQQADQYQTTIEQMNLQQARATEEGSLLATKEQMTEEEQKAKAARGINILSGAAQKRGLLTQGLRLAPKTITQAEKRGSLLGAPLIPTEGELR